MAGPQTALIMSQLLSS